MVVDLKEKLEELDKAKEQLIHDSFVNEQNQMDEDLHNSVDDLKKHLSESKGEQ